MAFPVKIELHTKSAELEIAFDSGKTFKLRAEYLRVHSPSAEVQGHGGIGGKLPEDKHNVKIDQVEPAGNYGLKIVFYDGHDTGIYTWEYLEQLGMDIPNEACKSEK